MSAFYQEEEEGVDENQRDWNERSVFVLLYWVEDTYIHRHSDFYWAKGLAAFGV